MQALKIKLSEHRFTHTINVAKEAGRMALAYKLNVEAAVVAALLHDYARELKEAELLNLAVQAGWPVNDVERVTPLLLHGPVGAFLAALHFGISDQDVLEAIKFHTTGCAGMDRLAKIVYLADMLEPGRKFPGVEKLRLLAYEDLDQALLKCLEHTIFYVINQGQMLHPLTVEARNELLAEKLKLGRG